MGAQTIEQIELLDRQSFHTELELVRPGTSTVSLHRVNCLHFPDWVHLFISLVIIRLRKPGCPNEAHVYYVMHS